MVFGRILEWQGVDANKKEEKKKERKAELMENVCSSE